jgi:hypothetical protein
MPHITIHPERFRQFGDIEGSTFCLVTNPELIDHFTIEESNSYPAYMKVPYAQGDSFDDLLRDVIPEPAHILVASPNVFLQSPEPEKLGPRRKMVAMACNSTPNSLESLAHFIKVIEQNDPQRQQEFAERFFELGSSCERLEIVDEEYGTRATFDHLDDNYEWNQQAGPLEWGEQQIAPAGELSVLPADIMQFNPNLRLAINGEIAFKGQAAVHSGLPSYLPDDQARIYHQLNHMKDHAVIVKIDNGIITNFTASAPEAEPAAKILQAMCDVDSRYRIIWEFGFGINTELELLPANCGMNEPYGGTNGVPHWGLGLTPYTQYALIIICPGSRILRPNGEVLIGSLESKIKKKGIKPKKAIACGCHY